MNSMKWRHSQHSFPPHHSTPTVVVLAMDIGTPGFCDYRYVLLMIPASKPAELEDEQCRPPPRIRMVCIQCYVTQ